MFLCGLMLLKDEADILQRTLDGYAKWLDGLVVLDNGSTDGSLEIAKQHPLVLKVEQDLLPFDETRMVPRIISMAQEYKPTWFVESDADEIFDPRYRGVVERAEPRYNMIGGRILVMMGEGYYVRERQWCRIFRNEPMDYSTLRKLHNGKAPIPRVWRRRLLSPLLIKHYQVRSYEQGMRKYNNYRKLDPYCQFQSNYEMLREMAEAWRDNDFSKFVLKRV
jgi:Glycosyl transferase family 2